MPETRTGIGVCSYIYKDKFKTTVELILLAFITVLYQGNNKWCCVRFFMPVSRMIKSDIHLGPVVRKPCINLAYP